MHKTFQELRITRMAIPACTKVDECAANLNWSFISPTAVEPYGDCSGKYDAHNGALNLYWVILWPLRLSVKLPLRVVAVYQGDRATKKTSTALARLCGPWLVTQVSIFYSTNSLVADDVSSSDAKRKTTAYYTATKILTAVLVLHATNTGANTTITSYCMKTLILVPAKVEQVEP